MALSAALAADLTMLTQTLGRDVELQNELGDLAADLAVVPGVGSSALVLDGHLGRLAGPTGPVGLDGLPAYVTINRAIGVLVDRGHTPDTARRELHRRAESDGIRLSAVAEQVLHSVAAAPWEQS